LQAALKFLLEHLQTMEGVVHPLLFLVPRFGGRRLDALHDCPMGVSNPLCQFADICFVMASR
jgi:hypothetical protein